MGWAESPLLMEVRAQRDITVLDIDQIFTTAKGLLSEYGENPEYGRAILELTADLTGMGTDEGLRTAGYRLGIDRNGHPAPKAEDGTPMLTGEQERDVLVLAAQQMYDLDMATAEKARHFPENTLPHLRREIAQTRAERPMTSLVRDAAQALFDIDEDLRPAMRHNDADTHERLRMAVSPLPGDSVKISRHYKVEVVQTFEVAMTREDALALCREDPIEFDEVVLGSRLLHDYESGLDEDDLHHMFA